VSAWCHVLIRTWWQLLRLCPGKQQASRELRRYHHMLLHTLVCAARDSGSSGHIVIAVVPDDGKKRETRQFEGTG
jgi:hypothetical protein